METQNQYIALINDYLNNVLSKEARLDFESKLQNDTAFNTLYQEHLIFINGLKRLALKNDIQKAKQSYHIEQLLKISGVAILVISVFITVYSLVFNTSEIEKAPNSESLKTIIIDSISNTSKSPTILKDSIPSKITVSKNAYNDTSTTTRTRDNRTEKATNPLKKQSQIFRVNTRKDTVIRCEEGTLLKIAKGSFLNPNTGLVISGTIDVNVTEYYKLSDMLLANLSTVSNGKPLETGGMLYIEAQQGTVDLKLKDNAPIEISFPTKIKKPDMQLFSGEWTNKNINWTVNNASAEDDLLIPEEQIDVPFGVVEVVPIFPGCETENSNAAKRLCTTNAIANFINKTFNTGVVNNLGLSGEQRVNSVFKIDTSGRAVFIQSGSASHPRLIEEANRVIGLLPKMIPGKQRGKTVSVPYSLPIRFSIGDQTSDSPIFISTSNIVSKSAIVFNPPKMDTTYIAVRGIAEFIREVMHDRDFPVDSLFVNEWERYKKEKLIRPIRLKTTSNTMTEAIVLRKPLFEMEGSTFKILDRDSITRGGHIIRVPWDERKIPTTSQVMRFTPIQRFNAGSETLSAKGFEARINNVEDATISSRDASYYILKSANLGWINCDRFINGRTKRIKYKLKVKNADGASISMVFKSMNSVLPSWYTNGSYDFQTVIANEDIVLVAIKRENGRLYYDTIETKTEANPTVDFDFKEVRITELKKQLDLLNNQ